MHESKNYTAFHIHTELSLLDSVTKYQDYIDRAIELGQTAIAFTEHGNIYQWVEKKIACEKAGLKYLHGCEVYLTEALLMPPDPKEVQKIVLAELENGANGSEDSQTYADRRFAELMESKGCKVRDNYHTILIAKNYAGLQEMNTLISRSSRDDHFYYKPRITFDEFLGLSENVIKISACLASPLNRMSVNHPMYERLLKHYDYLEIQAHNHPDQISYNCHLAEMSQKYHIPLIAGTDTHSLNKYKAECRTMLQLSKHIQFGNEDQFDLTYKTYDELVAMFEAQGSLPASMYLEAIENTNQMADSVESFELDTSFKYPILYGEKDREVLHQVLNDNLKSKVAEGAIKPEQVENFKEAIAEECRVFDKIEMSGFMLFMSELVTWCKSHGIPIGFNRGSCGGSRVAYVTNTTDLNPETWHTVFSRFCNEDRKEIGDIDIDVSPSQRDLVYEHIINRFGQEKTAFILAIGTIKDKGCIDEICRGLGIRWDGEHLGNEKEFRSVINRVKDDTYKIEYDNTGSELYRIDDRDHISISDRLKDLSRAELIKYLNDRYAKMKAQNEEIEKENPWNPKTAVAIKKAFEADEQAARKKYPEVFYYYDGLLGVAISQSIHPAGIVASPVTLRDNYGTFISDGKEILQIDMECVHEVSLVKYDILGLKNIEIVKDAYELLGQPYPKSHEINWNDEAVWKDMLRSPIGIFQFEGDFAFSMLHEYEPHNIFDMSLVTAALRPSGASYRNDLMQHKPHKNPSPIIDELLKDNNGYLIYQEDVIKFLQQICGFSGSDADNTRRAIARKDEDRLQKALPEILEGYCNTSPQPREIAEQEAKEFLQIIQDASSYMFGYNHSIGYCMIGYLCAYLRYYHPAEFITAYLNNANTEEDVKNGNDLALLYGVKIVPPRFGLSKDKYQLNSDENVISKGVSSVKYLNSQIANDLYDLAQEGKPQSFMDLLVTLNERTSLDTRQRDILVKIDYFSDYGNSRELLKMVDLFSFFKEGTMKKIAKDKLNPELEGIVSQYATSLNKSGEPAKSYTFIDMPGLLHHLECLVKDMHIQDFDLKSKMQTQLENLGYIDLTTNKKEDQRKLVITDVYPLRSKKTNETWAYAVQVRSIGTGKTNRWTIYSETFNRKPLQKFDIIYVPLDGWGEKRGYLYLYKYDYVI